MESSIIANYLTSDINFIMQNKDLFYDTMDYWYDETDFDINQVANKVISNFPNAKLISVGSNCFKFRWNNNIINISNYDYYN